MHYQPVGVSGDDMYLSSAGGQQMENLHPHNDPDGADDIDVWGADEEGQNTETLHSSDMRRLEAEHSTAGYREGITRGKEDTLQKGFDQGYSIGAAIGLQAGQLLGILEGIVQAVQGNKEAFDAAETLLKEANDELSIDKIFSSEFWTGEGLPKYEVSVATEAQQNGNRGDALAHPLLQKWTAKVDEKMSLWNIDGRILEHLNSEVPELQLDEGVPTTDLPPRNPLAW